MSGKPQFDDVAVIAAATEVFWRNGYAAAAISDLTEATGLSRSSLYQRFHDKDGLFQEALAAYTQRVLRRMNAVKADSARGRLRALLRAFLPDRSRPAGCLIGRSCAEISALSKEGQAATLAAAARQRDILARILREGVATGELAQGTDIDAMAWHYLGVLQSVLNFPQAGVDPGLLDRMIDVAMAVWSDTLRTD
ncbi:TetR/AcrR family transcriptional regulator [Bradyrhizobium sp. RD5-C2]|uniref:TetR/AcrR family transcriptional regulator n=1 Tax=Bradyrhizobium sp. RD5-C2 TaxID=244562 RepID=UPI001CC4057A|nr:TetR/AcrR family transcriptional regulator [Bradyrhizobium sp. RD5-C2]GIQ78295.1 TetR family transcriptional regulator [Bradyrhizobium sp. RD5-C2]